MHDEEYGISTQALERALEDLSFFQRRIVDQEIIADRHCEDISGAIDRGFRYGEETNGVCGVRGQIPDLAVTVVGRNSDYGRGENRVGGVCPVRRPFWWQEKGWRGCGEEIDSQGVPDDGCQGGG